MFQTLFNGVFLIQALGANITSEQINDMKKHADDYDSDVETQSCDVRSQVEIFLKRCEKAAPIILLETIPYFIESNTYFMVMRRALEIILSKIISVTQNLAMFADAYMELSAHVSLFTTVGKIAVHWLCDLLDNEKKIKRCKNDLRFIGAMATMNNIPSFIQLFHGDYDKVKQLDEALAARAGFKNYNDVIGHNYTNNTNSNVILSVGSLGITIEKMCSDIVVLANQCEDIRSNAIKLSDIDECKCNSRHMAILNLEFCESEISNFINESDDSDNQKVRLTQMLVTADTALTTLLKISRGLLAKRESVKMKVAKALPSMSENIVEAMIKAGADRNACNKKIAFYSHEDDFIGGIKKDPYFKPIIENFDSILYGNTCTGSARKQVIGFLVKEVVPLLTEYEIVIDDLSIDCLKN